MPLSDNETIQEYVDSRGQALRVDSASGVLRGVKLLGLASRNGRRYHERALRQAIPLYEGAKVNVNHPQGDPLGPRDYRDRIGVMRNVELRPGAGLFGSLHYNPKHPLAEQLAWDAQHAPENVGLSHNVVGRTTRNGAETVVESIALVKSVDLVADPATTSGLFEHREPPTHGDEPPLQWDAITLETLRKRRPDLLQEAEAAQRAKLDSANARLAEYERHDRLVEMLAEHGLPGPHALDPSGRRLTSEPFIESLSAAPDEPAMRRLIADRAELVSRAGLADHRGATSREQTPALAASAPLAKSQDFVAAVTRRL